MLGLPTDTWNYLNLLVQARAELERAKKEGLTGRIVSELYTVEDLEKKLADINENIERLDKADNIKYSEKIKLVPVNPDEDRFTYLFRLEGERIRASLQDGRDSFADYLHADKTVEPPEFKNAVEVPHLATFNVVPQTVKDTPKLTRNEWKYLRLLLQAKAEIELQWGAGKFENETSELYSVKNLPNEIAVINNRIKELDPNETFSKKLTPIVLNVNDDMFAGLYCLHLFTGTEDYSLTPPESELTAKKFENPPKLTAADETPVITRIKKYLMLLLNTLQKPSNKGITERYETAVSELAGIIQVPDIKTIPGVRDLRTLIQNKQGLIAFLSEAEQQEYTTTLEEYVKEQQKAGAFRKKPEPNPKQEKNDAPNNKKKDQKKPDDALVASLIAAAAKEEGELEEQETTKKSANTKKPKQAAVKVPLETIVKKGIELELSKKPAADRNATWAKLTKYAVDNYGPDALLGAFTTALEAAEEKRNDITPPAQMKALKRACYIVAGLVIIGACATAAVLSMGVLSGPAAIGFAAGASVVLAGLTGFGLYKGKPLLSYHNQKKKATADVTVISRFCEEDDGLLPKQLPSTMKKTK